MQHTAAAQATYTNLHNFNCTPIDYTAQTSTGTCNPVQPGILAQGTDGNFYGMACDYFTPCNYASIFRMTPSGVITILYKFDGITAGNPGLSGLTLGPDGNFYGVTPYGGTVGCGTVFQVTPSGAVSTLHSFIGTDPSNPASDGCNPVAPPVIGDDGYLYGTASNHAYRISTSGNFGTLPNTLPGETSSPLLLASDGNFYGTAHTANATLGITSGTAVFQMTPSGTVTQLYVFPANSSTPYFPAGYSNAAWASVLEGTDGNLYGTNEFGGAGNFYDSQGLLGDCDTYSCGTVYQLSKAFSPGWVHTFDGLEGSAPYAGLIAASDGNLYGAATSGSDNYGTLFKVDSAGNLTVLYKFEAQFNNCGTSGFNCGINPFSQPMQATSGLIYGMALYGPGTPPNAPNGQGTGVFYSLDAGLPAFIATIQPSGSVGQTIGIIGQGFSSATAVYFNGLAATFSAVSDTYLTATVPPGALTGPVTVTFASSPTLASNRTFRILASGGPSLTTTTSVVSSSNPSTFGQLVTFTATVTPQDGGNATGTVTFNDGTNSLGTSVVSGNSANLTVSTLVPGSHSITAVYSGDSNYLGSTSPSMAQIVNASIVTSDGRLGVYIPSFGAVAVGSNSSQTVLLSINAALALTSVQVSGDFSVTSNSCTLNVPLAAGTVCSLTVQFAPTAPGQRWFALTVQDNSGNSYEFGLQGTGIGPALAFTPGIISTVAGNGTAGYFGDGGPATSASLSAPTGITVDPAGNLYIADYANSRIRRVDASSGIISTVAGNGFSGFGGDGGPATSASLNFAAGVALDAAGNLYIADTSNHRIRRVDASSGIISTVAGNGFSGFGGDGGPATGALLAKPEDIAVDANGSLYIADSGNFRIRKVDAASGIISTVAGNGTFGFSGDGGPATSASLSTPTGIRVDSTSSLYIADSNNNRIRKVNASSGIISTLAGNGTAGFGGDGGPATGASLNLTTGNTVDAAGNLYIADYANSRIRKMDASSGIISTVAGNGSFNFSGDGGPATSASLYGPYGATVDAAGNLYIAGFAEKRIRKVDVTGSALSFSSISVGQTSAPQIIAISNVGNAPLNFSQLATSLDFGLQSVGNDCTVGTPLQPGASCKLGIVFAPTVAGNPLTGSLDIVDDSPGSPHTVSLSGIGLGTPVVSLSATSISFGNQIVGSASAPQNVGLTNTGSAGLSISSIAIAGTNAADFVQANNCPAILSAGAMCTIAVTFTPSAAANETAVLNISDDAAGGLQTVDLSGTGVVPAPVLVSIAINPSSPVVLPGGALQLTAIGNYSDGSTADLTSTVSWSSAQPTIATIGSTAGTQGLTTGVATGTDVITATFGAFSATATLTVDFALTGSLSTGRSLHTATQLNNGKVLIAGGVDFSGSPVAAAELYDPSTGTFTPTGSLNTARQYHTATLLNNGKVLIVGGCDTFCGAQISGSELYDPATGTFTPTGNLNTARNIHTATLLNNGKVLIAGGYGGGSVGILASAELYDPSTGSFAATGSLNAAREWHVATVLNTGQVLVSGGYNAGIMASAELYDPSTGTFTLTGSLITGRDAHSSTLLNNGQVLIASGWGGGASDLLNAELYDPVSGAFVATGSLITARQWHAAMLLNNGRVLIAGGSDTTNTYSASAEIYDPATGIFTSTGNLNTARDPHTATLLNNGNVLVVGGANSGGTLASAELFVPETLIPTNLVSISVSPLNPTVDLNATQSFIATGTFSDGSTQVLQSVTWSVSDPTLATITDDVTNRGTVFTLSGGSGAVSACAGSVCGSTNLTVGIPQVSVSTASVSFGNQIVGTASPGQTIVLNNNGSGTLHITDISLTGTNPGDFTESTSCGTTLAAGANCNIVVAFSPLATGPRSASVMIADNAASSPDTVSLVGTGVAAATTTTVTSSVNPSVFNQPVTLTATVTSTTGTPSGTVTFYEGSLALGTAILANGSGDLTISNLSVGSHSISATYAGDSSHGGSNSPFIVQTTSQATTTTTVVSSKNPQLIGQPITFTATVSSQYGGASTGSIVFKAGTTTLGTVALNGNQASLTTSFASSGTRSITAQYGGDVNNTGSTSSALSQSVLSQFSTGTVLVSSLNPSLVGQAVTFTANVTSAGGIPPDGELISFRRGATTLGMAPLAGGYASFSISTLAAGSNTITAQYPGDVSFKPSTSAGLAQVVNKWSTSASLTSSLNPSTYGQAVTLTANVTSAGPTTPTGKITFSNGATKLGTVTLGGGIATLTKSNLPTGTLSLTATYNGDANSLTSTSPVLAQVVNQSVTSTTITSSRNPSLFGQNVTFTATVTSATTTPTGSVTFTAGTTVLGTVTLNGSGTAKITTSTLPRGTTPVIAVYGGTASYTSSSSSLNQTVN